MATAYTVGQPGPDSKPGESKPGDSKPVGPPTASPVMTFKTPKNTLLYIVKAGIAKGDMSWSTIAIMGFMSGIYVGFGALLALTVAGGMPGESPGLIKFAVRTVKD